MDIVFKDNKFLNFWNYYFFITYEEEIIIFNNNLILRLRIYLIHSVTFNAYHRVIPLLMQHR